MLRVHVTHTHSHTHCHQARNDLHGRCSYSQIMFADLGFPKIQQSLPSCPTSLQKFQKSNNSKRSKSSTNPTIPGNPKIPKLPDLGRDAGKHEVGIFSSSWKSVGPNGTPIEFSGILGNLYTFMQHSIHHLCMSIVSSLRSVSID